MGILERFVQRRRERKQKLEEYEDNDKILRDIERKKLSHNEREMIAIMRKEKEKHLSEALKSEEIRRKNEEMLTERQMFTHGGFNLLE